MRIRAGFVPIILAGFFVVGIAPFISGCALLAAPAVENAGSLFGSTASGASGVLGAQSTAEVNKSTEQINAVQLTYIRQQISALSRQQKQEAMRRDAAVGILTSMAALDHDPQLTNLARWVEAGGDPQFALGYALARDKEDTARRRAVRMLEDMSEQRGDPQLYELARWVSAGGDEQFALNYALSQKARK